MTWDLNKRKIYIPHTFLQIDIVGIRADQMFQFFSQKTCFLENNKALSKFLYGILY